MPWRKGQTDARASSSVVIVPTPDALALASAAAQASYALFSDSAEDAESLAIRGNADFTPLLASRFLGFTPNTEPFLGGFSRIAYQPAGSAPARQACSCAGCDAPRSPSAVI